MKAPHAPHPHRPEWLKPHHVLIIMLSLWLSLIDLTEAGHWTDGHFQYGVGALLLGLVTVVGEIGGSE